MKDIIKDKLVEKKVEMFIKNFTVIKPARKYKRIINTFGNINYQYKGDSLYHLITKKVITDNIECMKLIVIMETLMDNGLDLNIRNDEGKTFLQTSDMKDKISFFNILPLNKMNLNNQDNEGKTILHNLVDENKSQSRLIKIYDKLEARMDTTIKDNKGQTFLDLLETKTNGLVSMELRRKYYETNFNCFVDKLDNNVDGINEFLNLIFNADEKETLHYWCQTNGYASDEDKLSAIKKLSDLNIINPNWQRNGFVHVVVTAINTDYSKKYVLKLADICLKHDFDINILSNIMRRCLEEYFDVADLVNIYTLLSKYGYSSLASDVDLFWPYADDKECYVQIRNNGFIKILNELLKEYNVIEGDCFSFDKDIINDILEIKDVIEGSLNTNNDYYMANLLAQKIRENRENNINIIEDKISLKELADAMHDILNEHVEMVNKSMKKRLSKYN